MAKSTLTDAEIDLLIDDAQLELPNSPFVASVLEWYEEHGFITEAQAQALQNIIDGD